MLDRLLPLAESLGLMAGLVLLYGILDRRLEDRPRLQRGLAMGLLFGAAGSVAMLLPVELQPGVIFDVRSVPLILVAAFGGPWAAVVAAVSVLATRMWIGGAGVAPAFVSLIGLVLLSLALEAARRRRPDFGPRYFALAGALGIVPLVLALLVLGVETATAILAKIALPWSLTTIVGCYAVGMMLWNEDVRRQTEIGLEAARRDAERANRAKSEFLSQMSHELRTPMTAIMGSLDLLALDRLSSDQKQLLDSTRRSAHHMLQLLNDLLDLAKIEADRLTLDAQPISLRALLGDLESLYKGQAESKGLDLRIDAAADLPDRVLLDGVRLRQILINLIGNALKFTQVGFVQVAAAPASSQEGSRRLRITVRDTGIGIPEHRHDAIFGGFEQADARTARTYGGSGLGLTISRNLARMMGGDIQVDSQRGLGSCFTLELPLRAVDVRTTLPDRARTDDVLSATPLAGRRILLAEDVEANRAIISRMLTALGAEVDTAANGQEAVERATAGYDAILMDMHMPVMDGSDATRQIRRLDDPAKDTPIIALTADITPDRKRSYHSAGLDAFLTKPVDWSDLVAVVTALMREARMGDAATEAEGARGEVPPDADGAAALPSAKAAEAGPMAWHGEVPDTPEPHEVLDSAMLADLERALGTDAVVDLLLLFPDTARNSLAELEAKAQDGPTGDLKHVQAVAHALKGAAANFGFHRLHTTVEQVQLARQRGDVQALLPRLRLEVDAACRAVEAYRGGRGRRQFRSVL